MPIGSKGQKRPRDPAQLAKLIVDIATGEVEDREPTREERGVDLSCFWAQVSENFLPDNLESDLSSSGFVRSPHSWVFRRMEGSR
jgi:hypothetical protein